MSDLPEPEPEPEPEPDLVPAPSVIVDADAELAAAVGVERRSGSGSGSGSGSNRDPEDPKRSKRGWVIAAIGVAIATLIGALIILGHVNAQTYAFTCTADKIIAEQGRAFPPWGTHALTDPDWKPIDIQPRSKCTPNTTDDRGQLASWFADALYDSASEELTPSPGHEVTKIDLAEQQVNQALLLMRTATKTTHNRDELERWLANVTYWRTQAKLHDAIANLGELANQFDQAAKVGPHAITNAQAWALAIRKAMDQLRGGPSAAGSTANAPPPPEEQPHIPAPPGAALPVESQPAAGSAAPPPDAGVPSGGVMI